MESTISNSPNTSPSVRVKKSALANMIPFGKVENWARGVSNSAAQYVQTGRKFVVANPVRGVAIAAAVGAGIGCLLTLAAYKTKD